jgi:hypothetical protein
MFGENFDDTGAGSRTRPKCGCAFLGIWTPSAEMRRIDFEPIKCSTCGEGFVPLREDPRFKEPSQNKTPQLNRVLRRQVEQSSSEVCSSHNLLCGLRLGKVTLGTMCWLRLRLAALPSGQASPFAGNRWMRNGPASPETC